MNLMASSSRRILPKGISLAGTFQRDIPPCLPLPSLPVFCGAVVQNIRLFDGEPTTSIGGSARWLNCDDVADQATIISKLLQATDVSYLEMDLNLMESMHTESTISLNTIVLKHNELLLAHTSDIKSLNEKITAEYKKYKEFHEDFKQNCIQLEAENKLLQQREDELKKTEVELKNRECKIVKEKRKRDLISSIKQLDNKSSREEDEDRKRELCALHKRTVELEDQCKVQNESLQRAVMEFETASQVSEDEKGMDLEEKLKNLESDLKKKRVKLEKRKNDENGLTSHFNVKDDELQDARLELIDGMKTNHKRACIGVKTLDVGKCPGDTVQQLWHNKEKREASVIEGIEYIMKKWKAERKQTMN